MTLSEVLQVSGSNLRSALPATALAITTTMSPPAFRLEEQDLFRHKGHFFSADTPTDTAFVLADADRDHADLERVYLARSGQRLAAVGSDEFAIKPGGMLSILGMTTGLRIGSFAHMSAPALPGHIGSTMHMAASFYEEVAAEAKSDLLWDIVALSYAANAPVPIVERIDGTVTVDFSAPGRLLSIMIDQEACFLSAFSSRKELKASFMLAAGSPRDELTDIIWSQLQDFRRYPIEA